MEKTAFIAIVGRPNVGKSTLMNHLLGEKVAIVSSRPQTTRNRITGILTKGENQFVFLDTPGVHKAKTKLGDYMMKSVRSTVGAADAIVLMYRNPEVRKRMGEAGRKLAVEKFDYQICFENIEKIFLELARNRTSGASRRR